MVFFVNSPRIPLILFLICLVAGRLLYLNSTPDVERTMSGVKRDMSLAARLKTPVNGLKGMSPLTKLAHFDLVWGYTVEYMHCVLLGVTRQFTDYWFDSSNNSEAYYIGKHTVHLKMK